MKINKILAGITILLLLALPASASDKLYGDANEDGVINMQDVTKVERIIMEYDEPTETADANMDDVINMLDVTNIELVILNRVRAQLEVTDDRGKTIIVPYPCERIVFLVENALNTMYALGGADNVVGIPENIWMPEEKEPFFRAIDPYYDDKVRVTMDGKLISLESLALADPELVVLWSNNPDDDNTVAIEETLGVPTFGVFIDDLDILSRQVEVFGRIIGHEERAQEVQDIMQEAIEKVTDVTGDIPDDNRPKVYWMWGDILGTAGLNSTANDLIYDAGGMNLMYYWDNEAKWMEHPILGLETLIDLNPEVIYLWYNAEYDPQDFITDSEWDAWRDIDALKNERIYEIYNPFLFDFHSPRLPLALMLVAKDIHPDKFEDLNMEEEIDNLFVNLYSVHYPGFEPV